MSPWLMLLPLGGAGWWLQGFPPGRGWIVGPMIPAVPVSVGMLLVLARVVIGAYAGLIWLRSIFEVGSRRQPELARACQFSRVQSAICPRCSCTLRRTIADQFRQARHYPESGAK